MKVYAVQREGPGVDEVLSNLIDHLASESVHTTGGRGAVQHCPKTRRQFLGWRFGHESADLRERERGLCVQLLPLGSLADGDRVLPLEFDDLCTESGVPTTAGDGLLFEWHWLTSFAARPVGCGRNETEAAGIGFDANGLLAAHGKHSGPSARGACASR
ncbi:hypothetical protein [Curtobacterium sp. MCSS17_016]|uniref:hypothetical protein n=1 Tax=Curtobacterium sp. MCSS17_016 TaxID=2175644 RepID=UPI0011B6F0D2|nr:hypothetical protein [Curtobacterium sp. MCSS17_016]WIE80838.1 hypothetical protein DEJ19_020190 [Curtobacterium sp. MCSS17_016]